jgi:hypothetical protein
MAAHRFSGQVTNEIWEEKRTELLQAVRNTPYEPVSEVYFFGYDPPAVPGPMRRNEVVVEVKEPKH